MSERKNMSMPTIDIVRECLPIWRCAPIASNPQPHKAHYLREVDTATLMLWRIPDDVGAFFVTIIGVRDRSAFRNRFGILALLPRSNPFVGVRISGLQEETAEIFGPANGN